MLDQNTDRMWYVIGAVIVGAAIILILNKTFPQLFASVGKTFEDKTEDVSTVVDDLGKPIPYVQYKAVSTGFSGMSVVTGRQSDSSIYNEAGKSIELDSSPYRGFELYIFDDTDTLEFHESYDVFGVFADRGRITEKLVSLTDSSKLIVLIVEDSIVRATESDLSSHLAGGLGEAMYDLGASSEVYANLGHREPYILVGKPGAGKGNGYELTGTIRESIELTIPMYQGQSPLLKK